MTIEEAITTAIEYETRVRDVYGDAREQVKHPQGQRVFAVLAEEEQRHVDYLHHVLKGWQETGKIAADRLATTIPPAEVIDQGIADLKGRMPSEDQDAEVALLRKALDVELETSGFYKRMVAELPEAGQELFARFVEIEEGHVHLVQAEIDSLTGLGFWFDMQEFDLEAG
jgi:rubrerythrin